jgi:hypothetical protein
MNNAQLLQVPVHVRKSNQSEPMTGDDYIKVMEENAAYKEAAEKEKHLRRQEVKFTKAK